ncbi:MAG TPA: M43 family zinc metalloprotease [Candidatus Eisenbacteria bacterium]|nr:M43 family zinc metalloprotease [Candidatus Eisenbacteria bacterium]
MPPLSRLSMLLVAMGLAGPMAAEAQSVEASLSLDPEASARTCGTPRPGPQELLRIHNLRRRLAQEPLLGVRDGGTIRVAFHVLMSAKAGAVTDAQITAQIDELNRAYSGTGYSFELVSVDRTENNSWFRMTPGTGKEWKAKEALAVDPAHTLNIYTGYLGGRLLGWAYFPWSIPEDHFMHGVVVHYGSLPGGYLSAYNLGRSMVHEVGHYLGLLHTFENGCEAPGDLVEDTAYEESPAYGCPVGRNTCPDPDDDPIHNYMDYGDDACVTEFTAGQANLMHDVVPAYRPSLFAAKVARGRAQEIVEDTAHPADLSGGIEFRGAGPNPFRLASAVRFTLPRADRVQLQVFNVAGQRVRSLIDAQMPAGAHSAMFAAQDLPAGMYFLRLRVGRTEMNRSVILLK